MAQTISTPIRSASRMQVTDQAVDQQRFALVNGQAVDDAILCGIQTCANRLGEIGMWR